MIAQVLQRDSAYWRRAGFMACIVEEGGGQIRYVCACRQLLSLCASHVRLAPRHRYYADRYTHHRS